MSEGEVGVVPHVNPAVTVVATVARGMPARDFVGNRVAQLIWSFIVMSISGTIQAALLYRAMGGFPARKEEV